MSLRGPVPFLLPVVLLLAAGLLHLCAGALPMGPGTVLAAVLSFDPTNYSHVVVVLQRMTRLVVAIYAGAVLGVAGLLLQKIMQNGLVSPSTLGVNAGATASVVLAVHFLGMTGAQLFLPALTGGLISIGLTFFVSGLLRGYGDPRLNIVLSGMMVGTLFSSLTTFVIALDPDGFSDLIGWLIGDISNFDYVALQAMAPVGLVALVLAALLFRAVDILALGGEQAAVLGVDVRLIFAASLLAAVVLAVSAVTVVGPIGFVGLVVPHIVRLTIGDTGLRALWGCLTGGAIILTLADVLARTALAPRVLNVGTVMGLAGGLIFLGLVLSRARRAAP